MSSEEVVKFVRDRINGTASGDGENGNGDVTKDDVTENGDTNGTNDEKCEKVEKLSTICEQVRHLSYILSFTALLIWAPRI